MRLNKNKLVFSPTDLTKYIDSPFASHMDRLSLNDPSLEDKKIINEKREELFEKGKILEDKFLESFDGKDFVLIQDNPTTSKKDTLEAIKKGVQTIAQAHLSKDPFSGFADILERVEGKSKLGDFHYTVKDIKRSRVPKTKFVLQICAYVEMLYEIQGVMPEYFYIILGDLSEVKLKTNEFYDYYLKIKEEFLNFHDNFDSARRPIPDKDENFWEWGDVALEYLQQVDHISLIANITKDEQKELIKNQIYSIRDFINSSVKLNIPEEKRVKLLKQAKIQKASQDKVKYEVLNHKIDDPKGLLNLPEKNENDCFINISYSDSLDENGLSYSFSIYGKVNKTFICENKKNEKEVFEKFMDSLPKEGKIFHFSNKAYDILIQMAAKYHTKVDAVDDIIFKHRLIDVLKIIKQSVVIGVTDYSLLNLVKVLDKNILLPNESVLMGEYLFEGRDDDTLKEVVNICKTKTKLIKDLVDWLYKIQKESENNFIPFDQREESKVEVVKKEKEEEEDKVEIIPFDEESYQNLNPVDKGQSLLQQLVNFHKQESKPSFLDLLDKFKLEEIEWEKELRCLAFLYYVKDFDDKSPHKRWYRFDPKQETKVSKGDSVQVYQNRRINANVVDMDLDNSLILVQFTKKQVELVKTYKHISLISNNRIFTKGLEKSLKEIYVGSDELNINKAARDFILKNYPDIKGIKKGEPLYTDKDDILDKSYEVISRMNESCLIIQGPPGAGKSYTSCHIIEQLVKDGKKVGISSNSHKAINNLLSKFESKVAKVNSKKEEGLDVEFIKSAREFKGGFDIIGGTAFAFSHENFKDYFDYLFIDEAGQVSLANLIAMSRCAKNLILIGDQMQLEQPLQGIHPGDSGKSCLEYFLKGFKTIPKEYGFFLNQTRRMNDELCRVVSENFYEGKLFAHESTKDYHIEVDGLKNRGVQFIDVPHKGNVQYADEEVIKIEELISKLLGNKMEVDGEVREITKEDIIIVSPYNLQVSKLKQVFEGRVGSVDLFQGQEAPIVIISLAASDGNGGRGLEFVLSPNRLNVALSRGKCISFVVASSNIIKSKADSIGNARLLNIFAKLLKEQ